MKTKTKAHLNGVASQRDGVIARRVVVKGKRMVQLDEAEFDRLLRKADEWEPPMPEPNPVTGNYPAIETGFISLAIDIIRDRRRLGLTQADLARRAGIRLATLQRVESGERRPTSVRTIEKIDRALQAAEKKAAKP
jgi:DNA-binding XRE family transcriptional regulator